MWKPLTKAGLIAGLVLAAGFWIYALRDEDGFLFLDYVNLPFHEFGHFFFGIFGETIGIWGGTIMQLVIPLGIFVNFLLRKEIGGTALSAFWVGENLLNIAVYIADARNMDLPLVCGGEHDWNIILGKLGMLNSDTMIGAAVKTSGWLIMISAVLWFLIKGIKIKEED